MSRWQFEQYWVALLWRTKLTSCNALARRSNKHGTLVSRSSNNGFEVATWHMKYLRLFYGDSSNGKTMVWQPRHLQVLHLSKTKNYWGGIVSWMDGYCAVGVHIMKWGDIVLGAVVLVNGLWPNSLKRCGMCPGICGPTGMASCITWPRPNWIYWRRVSMTRFVVYMQLGPKQSSGMPLNLFENQKNKPFFYPWWQSNSGLNQSRWLWLAKNVMNMGNIWANSSIWQHG